MWKTIKGFENYQVSTEGKIRDVNTMKEIHQNKE